MRQIVSELDLIVTKEAVGVGDHRVYLGGQTAGGAIVLSRQGLHATMISFAHPTKKKQMKVVAPLYKVRIPHPTTTHHALLFFIFCVRLSFSVSVSLARSSSHYQGVSFCMSNDLLLVLNARVEPMVVFLLLSCQLCTSF
jgi:hypothetical protein